MKNALLVGCGNTRGEKIILGCKNAGYNVTNIGQTQSKIDGVNNITVTWKELGITNLHKILYQIKTDVDFIFFNQTINYTCSQIIWPNFCQAPFFSWCKS